MDRYTYLLIIGIALIFIWTILAVRFIRKKARFISAAKCDYDQNQRIAFHELSYIEGKLETLVKTVEESRRTLAEETRRSAEYYVLLYSMYVRLCLAVWRDPYGAYVWKYMIKGNDTTPDSFYLGIGMEPDKQIRLQLPLIYWEQSEFAKTLTELPEYDNPDNYTLSERINSYLR